MTGATFSKEQKRAAIEMWKAKVPLKTIRNQLDMSESTLRRILKFAKANPGAPVAERKKGNGPISNFTTAVKNRMKAALCKTPTMTAASLKKAIPELANVSIRRIQEVCKNDLKLPSRKMADKPLLNDRMKEDRLRFARAYGHWGVEEWRKVMFSDESHFELRFGQQGWRCRRSKGSDRFDPKFTRKKVKHPVKVMVWGSFSWRGRGGLEFLNTGEMMNGERYRRLLDEKLEFLWASTSVPTFCRMELPATGARL